ALLSCKRHIVALAERGEPFSVVVNHGQHAREQQEQLVIHVQVLSAQCFSDQKDAGGKSFALQERKGMMIDTGVSVVEGDRRQRLVERIAALETFTQFIQRQKE